MNKELLTKLGFKDELESFENGECTICKKEVGTFRDMGSKREYQISGMCQKCQDRIFGE